MKRPELESALEDRCVAKIEALGGMALKLSIPGVRGFPDRSCFLPQNARYVSSIAPGQWQRLFGPEPGRLFFIEVKRLKTGRVSVQQERWAAKLRALGFKVYFIDNDAAFDAVLEEWK